MTTLERDTTLAAADLFEDWLATFAADIVSGDPERVTSTFRDDSYWRDILSLTWQFRTFSGPQEIQAAIGSTLDISTMRNLRPSPGRMEPRLQRRSGRSVIEAFFDFDTAVGRGSAFVRLQLDDASGPPPQVWLLLTTLQELTGFEERIGPRRPSGTEYSYTFAGDNWLDKRIKSKQFEDREPEVLIVGGAQAGLALGARFRQMGVDALIVEANERIGDNWRQRYHSLTLHNEVWSNHLPYLDFPETWPTFLPKDMVATWLESYAEIMELDVWTSTRMLSADFDEQSRTWQVRLSRPDGTERVMTVPHLVMATGTVAGAPIIPELPGLSDFGGEVVHSAAFTSGAPYAGKNAIVIGTGNSGHDVAQDLHSNGANQVTIVQRSSTCVVSLEPSGTIVYSLYAEGHTEDIDLITASIPYPVLHNSYQWLTKKTCALDKDLLDSLQAVGFEVDMGEDDTGFHMKYLRYGGGYYINVGCSELIASGQIGLAHARDLDRFVADGMRLVDGTVIPADVVVLATGFETQITTIRRLLGDAVAGRIGVLWGFDEQGFMRNMWQRTGQDRLWVMGGALNDCRLYSRFLALQIKADLEGILPAQP